MSLQAETSATVNLNSRTAKVFGVGTNDSLSLNGQGKATVAGGIVTAVDSLSAGGEWTVQGGTDRSVVLGSDTIGFARAADNLYGVITAGTQGNKAAIISDLAGDVSVKSGSSVISGLQVVENVWTISGAVDSVAAFDSLGTSATVTAQNSDLTVAATSNASVVVNGQNSVVAGKFNGVTVNATDSNNQIVVKLEGESDGTSKNLEGISGLSTSAVVTGDSLFTVNDSFTIQNLRTGGTPNTKFSVGSGSSPSIIIQSVNSNDNYSVTGGNVVYDLNSIAANSNGNVMINGAGVSITTASDASNDAVISGTGSDAVLTISGVNIKDTIKTSDDTEFTVRYNKPTSLDDDKTDAIVVNNVTIRADEENLTTDTSLIVSVKNSGSASPNVTISGLPTGESATITVSAGVYNVGSSSPVTINETVGYLYIDTSGNVIAEDESVADVRKTRDNNLNALASAQAERGANVSAFETFYDIYNANFPSNIGNVANFPTVTVAVEDVSSTATTTGANIYGDSALTGYPEQITLQSYVSNPIVIKKIEGVTEANGGHTVRTAVVDARGGNADVIALGMDTTDADKFPQFATNHTIYGSNTQSTIMVGPQATGNHMIVAGSVGSYLYHNAGGKGGTASIFGGAGNDTIIAEKGDHVSGGRGEDYFFDSQPYQIDDYSLTDQDIIVATKLSSRAAINTSNVTVSGNTIAIAGGSVITLGSSYDGEALAALITDVSASRTSKKLLAWAGTNNSVLDARSVTLNSGAIMISTVNGGKGDTVYGTGYSDSVFAGANDYVNSGAGNDTISLAEAGTNENGAIVALSTGNNVVKNWKGGFDKDEGANILEADALTTTFRRDGSGYLKASFSVSGNDSVSSGSMNFEDLSAEESIGAYRFLVGNQENQKKLMFIDEGRTANITSNDNWADIFRAQSKGKVAVTDGVDQAILVNLSDTDTFTNVTSVDIANNNRATVIGSTGNDTISVSGLKESGAHKTVMSGAGNDSIISGGGNTDSSLLAGNHLFFGTGNAFYSSGRDTIQGLKYYSQSDADGSNADVIHLGNYDNLRSISVSNNKAEIALSTGSDNTTITINDTFSGEKVDTNVVRMAFDDIPNNVFNVKFGVSTSNNNFTYDGSTKVFWGNSNGRDRDNLIVANNDLNTNVNIWLNNKEQDNTIYQGIGLIDARQLTGTKATLVGNYSVADAYGSSVAVSSNTIYGGGAGTQSTLWGGGGTSNTLIGGDGTDEFLFFKSFGYTTDSSEGNVKHGSNDVINNVSADDLVRLGDILYGDLDLEKSHVSSDGIVLQLKDENDVKGGSLTINGFGSEVNFKLSDGNAYKATFSSDGNVAWS